VTWEERQDAQTVVFLSEWEGAPTHQQEAEKILGYPGRLLSQSKGNYNASYPDHVVVFNGNVFAGKKSPTKIWYGDLDLTAGDKERLQQLSNKLGLILYVVREMAGRFDHEFEPDLSDPVAVIHPDPRNKEVV
jgi:hypothetical protein